MTDAEPRCELLWDPSCPNVEAARDALRAALVGLGLGPRWIERRVDDPALPEHARGYASPTILVDGRDVAGAGPTCGSGCRVYAAGEGIGGAPSPAMIAAALRRGARARGELVLVRHGETLGNSSVRLYGATDIGLSPLGEAQMRRAADALRGERFDRLVTSPLSRAQRSAAIVREALAEPPPLRVVDALRERDVGSWEGWTVDEVAARDPAGYRRWREGGLEFAFPGGEARQEVVDRVLAALHAPGDPLFPTDARTIAVLHKGIIKVLLGALLGLDFGEYNQLPVALGSIHRLEAGEGGWRLVAGNLVDHLGDAFLES
ncbi:MAG: histidine phosphatase family protein [Myxococcales bacterium]|nr:histidine phosphatase family protein [Myxococcales bacterium]